MPGCTNYRAEGDEYGTDSCTFYRDGAQCAGRHGQCPHQGPATHKLKIWPEHFNAVVQGLKTAEVRKDDRGFQVGDVLVLREYKPPAFSHGGVSTRDGHYTGYTGDTVKVKVTHILDDSFIGIAEGFVVLSFRAA